MSNRCHGTFRATPTWGWSSLTGHTDDDIYGTKSISTASSKQKTSNDQTESHGNSQQAPDTNDLWIQRNQLIQLLEEMLSALLKHLRKHSQVILCICRFRKKTLAHTIDQGCIAFRARLYHHPPWRNIANAAGQLKCDQ